MANLKPEDSINSNNPKSRSTYRSIFMNGRCETCDIIWSKKNALGLAAQHTDRTGHETTVDVDTHVRFVIE